MSLSGQDIAKGNLQRNFKRVILGVMDNGSSDSSSVTQRVWLRNLSKNVSLLVQTGFVNTASTQNLVPTYPALPGTLQITPVTQGDGSDQYLYGNPVFSTPAFTGALTIPNGWEWQSVSPLAAIDVTVNPTPWPTATAGMFVLDVIAEFTGAWWDAQAVAQLLNKITVEPAFTQFHKTGGT